MQTRERERKSLSYKENSRLNFWPFLYTGKLDKEERKDKKLTSKKEFPYYMFMNKKCTISYVRFN